MKIHWPQHDEESPGYYAPAFDHPHSTEESAAQAEAFTRRIADSLRRHGECFPPADRQELARQILALLQRQGREAQSSKNHREGELPDAAIVDPWAVAGEGAADRRGDPPAEQKQLDCLLRQLLRAAEKILAHLAPGAGGRNPFDFSP